MPDSPDDDRPDGQEGGQEDRQEGRQEVGPLGGPGDALSGPRRAAALPTRDEVVAFIETQPGGAGKREILRAFAVKGDARREMKALLAELADEGLIDKTSGRFSSKETRALPPVTLLEAIEPDADGELRARPANWSSDAAPPSVVMAPARKSDPALGPGDRFLGRLTVLPAGGPYAYEARVIKKLGRGAKRILGVYREMSGGGRILPTDKRDNDEYAVAAADAHGAVEGDLVEAETVQGGRFGLRRARVVDRLGDTAQPRAMSLIAIHAQGLPVDFPEEATAEAETASPLTELGEREDLRGLPLITIDPADARDHDDAVYAEPDGDPANAGGFRLWVAIADVAHYVRPDSALDRAARMRGNSAYFPDRVVPMLPDRLSGDLCSLVEGADRPCLTAKLVIAADGALKSADFSRSLMRSAASLTYEQAQTAWESGAEAAGVAPKLADAVISPLFAAYHALERARERRSPLDLELPEREVKLDASGRVGEIRFRERFEAHKLIEEFMVLANVAAAEALEKRSGKLLYRVHEEPNPDKIDALREVLGSVGVPLAKGQVMTTKRLNAALDRAADGDHAELVNMSVLRSQTQAYYGPENFGHFGLALRSYAHFTSPIRRYADLLLHRALISAFRLPGWRTDGQTEDEKTRLKETGEHISMTERRAMTAERDAIDRYLASYLADRQGAVFEGRIAGVQRFGLFVKLDESGADGFIPIATLGAEYFHYDEAAARLVGDRSGAELRMGAQVRVRLVEATPVTGGLILELLDLPNYARLGGGGRAESIGGRRGAREKASKGGAKGQTAAKRATKAARKARRKAALSKRR